MILAWSMDCLYSGLWPSRDHRGVAYHPQSKEYKKANSPLAGGFYCTLVGLCGDLDYFAKFLSMPHWVSHNPCGWCGCTKLGPLTWKDSRETAPWRATVHTTSSWLENPDRSQCPIFHSRNQKHHRTHCSARSYACEIFGVPAVFLYFLFVAAMS